MLWQYSFNFKVCLHLNSDCALYLECYNWCFPLFYCKLLGGGIFPFVFHLALSKEKLNATV